MVVAPCVLGLKAQQRRRSLIRGKKGILCVCVACACGWAKRLRKKRVCVGIEKARVSQ